MEKTEKNKNSMEAPQDYEAPAIVSVEVAVEKGFAGSGPDNPVPLPTPEHPWR